MPFSYIGMKKSTTTPMSGKKFLRNSGNLKILKINKYLKITK